MYFCVCTRAPMQLFFVSMAPFDYRFDVKTDDVFRPMAVCIKNENTCLLAYRTNKMTNWSYTSMGVCACLCVCMCVLL